MLKGLNLRKLLSAEKHVDFGVNPLANFSVTRDSKNVSKNKLFQEIKRFAIMARLNRINIVALENVSIERVKKMNEMIGNSLGVEFVSKRLIVENKKRKIKDLLTRYRYAYEIITVVPQNKEIAKWCAHDRRIDSLKISIKKINEIVDAKLFNLLHEHKTAFEINLSEIINALNTKQDIQALRALYKIKKFLSKRSIPIVISSGAKTPLKMRSRLITRTILKMMGIPFERSRFHLHSWPVYIIYKNRLKISRAAGTDFPSLRPP